MKKSNAEEVKIDIKNNKIMKKGVVMKKYETGYKIVNKQSLTSAVISGKDCALKYKVNNS